MKPNVDLTWWFRFQAAELGLRGMPIEPSGGRGGDSGGLTARQRFSADRSSQIRLALSAVTPHQHFVLARCYEPRPDDAGDISTRDAADPWAHSQTMPERIALDVAKSHLHGIAAQARQLRRDAKGQTATVAAHSLRRASEYESRESAARQDMMRAESVLAQARKRYLLEAAAAQNAFEAALSDVRGTQAELADICHQAKLEQLEARAKDRGIRRLLRSGNKAARAMADSVLAIMGLIKVRVEDENGHML